MLGQPPRRARGLLKATPYLLGQLRQTPVCDPLASAPEQKPAPSEPPKSWPNVPKHRSTMSDLNGFDVLLDTGKPVCD